MTSYKLSIIAATLPPKLDGIGDYTAHLAAELATQCDVTILTGQAQEHTPIPGVRIKPAFAFEDPASTNNLLTEIKADAPDWVLLQYNCFSYGRWGLNLHLPAVMARLKRVCPRTRFALMVHEPFVPVLDWKHAVMTTWQRAQLWSLGRSADVVFFSIDPWARKFRPWFPDTPVLHLPIGSNMPCVPADRAAVRARLGIADTQLVLGLFGQAHNAILLEWLVGAAQAAQQAGHDPLVLYVGPQEARVRNALGTTPLRTTGPLSGEDVSTHLQAIDIFLLPFVDGVSTRRTSLMAALQHGLPVVGTDGLNTDKMLWEQSGYALLLSDVRHQDEFNASVLRLAAEPALRTQIGQAGQQFFAKSFSWPQIAHRLLAVLEDAAVQTEDAALLTRP